MKRWGSLAPFPGLHDDSLSDEDSITSGAAPRGICSFGSGLTVTPISFQRRRTPAVTTADKGSVQSPHLWCLKVEFHKLSVAVTL